MARTCTRAQSKLLQAAEPSSQKERRARGSNSIVVLGHEGENDFVSQSCDNLSHTFEAAPNKTGHQCLAGGPERNLQQFG
jgi:hypothetical protein